MSYFLIFIHQILWPSHHTSFFTTLFNPAESSSSSPIFHIFSYPFDFSLSCIGEGNGTPLQYSCLENPRDGGAWWASVYGGHTELDMTEAIQQQQLPSQLPPFQSKFPSFYYINKLSLCKLVQPLWKIVWRFLRKLNLELQYDPAIPLLGIYPDKTIIQKIYAPLCSQLHYLQQPSHENKLHIH